VSDFIAVIMAGGKGQRFWPLSTVAQPKQFLDLSHSGQTLIQGTLERILPLTSGPERVFVATAERYTPLVRQQLPEIPAENLLIEPVGRDSAPAVALASLAIHQRHGDAIVGFFSSDHRIGNPECFMEAVRAAAALAEARKGLVTIGIRPTRPATGYGYIEQGPRVGAGFKVARFVEKPTLKKAQSYLEAETYLWNAGIFVWSLGTILTELDTYAPALMRPLRRAFEGGRVDAVFPQLTRVSIDYAVMEHTSRAYVVPGEFDWDDIGYWVALERLLKRNADDPNTVVGRHVGLEASGNIIYTEDSEDVVVTLGVKNLVIVKRGKAILLVRKDRVGDIKRLLQDERLAELIPD